MGPVRALQAGGVDRERRFRHGGALHPTRVDETGAAGALDRRLEARGSSRGGPALGQVQRGHAHRQRCRELRAWRSSASGCSRVWCPRWAGGWRPSSSWNPVRRGCGDRPLRPCGIGSGRGVDQAGRRARRPVRARRQAGHLAGLPPDYLRIASGLGGAAPTQAVAWPLASRDALLAVLEVASFARSARGSGPLEELLPGAALSLQVLQRNLGTQELLPADAGPGRGAGGAAEEPPARPLPGRRLRI